MNYREKIISENIALCLKHKDLLTDWELNFVNSVDGQYYDLRNSQFNCLNSIAHRINTKIKFGLDSDWRKK